MSKITFKTTKNSPLGDLLNLELKLLAYKSKLCRWHKTKDRGKSYYETECGGTRVYIEGETQICNICKRQIVIIKDSQ